MTDNKTDKKNNSVALAAIIVLAIALIGLSIFTYSQYSEGKEVEMALQADKDSLKADLTRMSKDYETRLEEKDSLYADLYDDWTVAKNEVDQYLDSINGLKVDINSLRRYRYDVSRLKKEYALLQQKYDSVLVQNQRLDSLNVALDTNLGKQIKISDSLVVQTTQLSDKVALGSALQLSDLKVDAVKVKNSGKMKSTQKARRADRVKVCFTVAPNKLAESEDKKFYIKVVAPGEKILGENAAVMVEGKDAVTYTSVSEFYYENDALDVCEYIKKPAGDFSEGKYLITLYDAELNELGSTSFTMD
ncbi:hypothetical protein [Neptunitalea lumnitzerae]|uniref:Chromosome partitioning protein ParA n=1 Tax=Neptunitalea lumnitzerae TaxID=2965509 RepID=A0ABQ5MIG9_9FLAO|nr:hypothetical protein [Neptunitalea sp. Y10]GLB49188.1 hypothetical protein Y10_15560 [Neptunitalea sp. Y10]